MSTGMIEYLTAQRDRLLEQCERDLQNAKAAGRERFTAGEKRALDDLEALGDRIAYLTREEERSGVGSPEFRNLSERVNRTPTTNTGHKMSLHDGHLTYRHNGSESWLKDLILTSTNRDGDGEARRRLASHAHEVVHDPAFMEARDLSRVDGNAGYFVPPAWLVDQWIAFARPGRAFANILSAQARPGGTDSINV